MSCTRRSLLALLGAAGAAKALDAVGAPLPDSDILAVPPGGVKIEWGYKFNKGIIIELEHSGLFRNPFDTNLGFFFPNQLPANVTNGFRQSSTGTSQHYIDAVGQPSRSIEYHGAFRDRDGSVQYNLQGDPLNGDASKLSLACPLAGKATNNPPAEDGILLTDTERAQIENRINSGKAVLTNTPPIYTRPFGYELADGRYFIAYLEEANWPDGQTRAYIGSKTSWLELHNVKFIDATHVLHGVKTDEGFLAMPPPFSRQPARWNGELVKRILTDEEAIRIAGDLKASPAGRDSLKKTQLVTPCSGPGY